jgi:putative intracellular protease/amidase
MHELVDTQALACLPRFGTGRPLADYMQEELVDPLFDRFEPLDAVGPYEILAHVPGAKVRFVAPESGRITDVLGSLPRLRSV